MIDFTHSLSLGMQIAQKKHENFIEIHNVFAELKKQIEGFSNNKVVLELIAGTLGDYFKVHQENPDILYEDKKLYVCLASNPDGCYSLITQLNLSRDGYPCTIQIEGDNYDSFDKSSLEENLNKLLSTAYVGEQIFKMIKTPDTNITSN